MFCDSSPSLAVRVEYRSCASLQVPHASLTAQLDAVASSVSDSLKISQHEAQSALSKFGDMISLQLVRCVLVVVAWKYGTRTDSVICVASIRARSARALRNSALPLPRPQRVWSHPEMRRRSMCAQLSCTFCDRVMRVCACRTCAERWAHWSQPCMRRRPRYSG
jgi:hypothetical protein